MIMEYLQAGTMAEESKKAHELILTQSQYEVVDGELYHVEADKTLRDNPANWRSKADF